MINIFTERFENFIYAACAELDIFNKEGEILFDFVNRIDGKMTGSTIGDDERVEIEIALKDPETGEKLDKEVILQNIAHELVHAKQMLEGRLIDSGLVFLPAGDCMTLAKKVIWNGQDYTGVPYDQQPWEEEAYALESQVKENATKYLCNA